MNRLRVVLLLAVMASCFAFGAMVHAYASGSTSPSAVGAPAIPASGAAATASSMPRSGEASYVVVRGDTLWSIAARHVPAHQSIQQYIEAIKQSNHLAGSKLAIGDVLKLPSR